DYFCVIWHNNAYWVF
nr:immunoglobulin light chain junction region [Macaca mulatta]MOW05998.1 immunoglobulin light chain junction region [Macaca mulatta]MOY06848.1 immunoglobulin light chain junction region [Macaca mulatta]